MKKENLGITVVSTYRIIIKRNSLGLRRITVSRPSCLRTHLGKHWGKWDTEVHSLLIQKKWFPNTQTNGKPSHVPARFNIIKTLVPPKQSMYLIPIKITMVIASGMEKSILNFEGNQ